MILIGVPTRQFQAITYQIFETWALVSALIFNLCSKFKPFSWQLIGRIAKRFPNSSNCLPLNGIETYAGMRQLMTMTKPINRLPGGLQLDNGGNLCMVMDQTWKKKPKLKSFPFEISNLYLYGYEKFYILLCINFTRIFLCNFCSLERRNKSSHSLIFFILSSD